MGFSIGSLLKAVAPIVGGIIGGPAGALIGGAVSAGFSSVPRPSIPGPTVQVGIPAVASVLAPLARQAGGMAFGLIAGILATSKQNTGRPVSAKKIREAARVCGMEVAAQTFGISVTDVCTIIVSKRTRRGRGISAADLRRTRSTIRKISTMQHSLAHFVSHQKRGASGKFI